MYGTNSVLMRAKLTRGQLKWVDANKKYQSFLSMFGEVIAWLFSPVILYLLYLSYTQTISPMMENSLVFLMAINIISLAMTFALLVLGVIALSADKEAFAKGFVSNIALVYPVPPLFIWSVKVISWTMAIAGVFMAIATGYVTYSVAATICILLNAVLGHLVKEACVKLAEDWIPDLNKERIES